MFDALSRREDYEELIKEGQRIDVRCLAFIKYYFVSIDCTALDCMVGCYYTMEYAWYKRMEL